MDDSGARVPFVLREKDHSDGVLELLGETYVHGYMEGQMATAVGDLREVIIR